MEERRRSVVETKRKAKHSYKDEIDQQLQERMERCKSAIAAQKNKRMWKIWENVGVRIHRKMKLIDDKLKFKKEVSGVKESAKDLEAMIEQK